MTTEVQSEFGISDDPPPDYPALPPELHRELRLAVEYVPLESLSAYVRALRTPSKEQRDAMDQSIRAFGLVVPLTIDEQNTLISGHAVLAAARRLGYSTVPIVRLAHLNDAQKRALRIALNRLAELSGWDEELLRLEFKDLLELDLSLDLDFSLTITGFSSPEIDRILETGQGASDGDDDLPDGEASASAVSCVGDMWELGDHRLICGDARDAGVYARLFGDERAALAISDAPYDLPVSGMVAKPGRHREFVAGSGELKAAFTPFLTRFLQTSTAFISPGAYHQCFMDWRHMGEMLEAGRMAGLELKNLCVWAKGAGAMGSLYRSAHELIFVFKEPSAPGTNNVMLGKFGRNRTNVFEYPGSVAMRKELELHPTPKPVALVADVIRDVSHRGDIVLDCFSGSGTTIIAAAKTGRRGYAIELDPLYVDVAIRRWQTWSGGTARLAESGLTFAEVAERRSQEGEGTAPISSVPPARVRVRQRARAAA